MIKKYPIYPKPLPNGDIVEILKDGSERVVFADLPFAVLKYKLKELMKDPVNLRAKFEIKYY